MRSLRCGIEDAIPSVTRGCDPSSAVWDPSGAVWDPSGAA